MFLFEPEFLNKHQADWLFNYLKTLEFETITYSNGVKMPRQTLWFATGDISYTYSGIKNSAAAFPLPLDKLLKHVTNKTNQNFNSLLINKYRNGRDSIGLHADDEPELGENPYILSLSVGDTRKFTVIENSTKATTNYHLTHGSGLHMFGESQKLTKHMLPKAPQAGLRFNLTFRTTWK